jgi:hypothetical protein
MAAYRKGRFSWRAFVSLFITWASLILIVSGIILYIAPTGRIANWTHISILGLEKSQWQALHTIFSFIILIPGAYHLYYNWRPFVSYLRKKMNQMVSLRKELTTTVALTVILSVLTIWNVPPFSTIMDLGEYFTESWESVQNEPPIPHAEELTIAELAKTINKPTEQLLSALKQNGIEATSGMVVKEVAAKYGLTPSELYQKMQIKMPTGATNATSQPPAWRGLGHLTIEQVCQQIKIPLDTALARLAKNNIMVDKSMLLKDIAGKYNRKPIDILEIMENKKRE